MEDTLKTFFGNCISTGLDLLRNTYSVKELKIDGFLWNISFDRNKCDTHQYEIAEVGSLAIISILEDCGSKYEIFIITPYYKNLPLLALSEHRCGNTSVFSGGLFNLVDIQDQLYFSYIDRFSEITSKYSFLEDSYIDPCWYDDIRPFSFSKKYSYETNSEQLCLFSEIINMYIEMDKAFPLLDDVHYLSKWHLTYDFTHSLINKGSPLSDILNNKLKLRSENISCYYSAVFASYRYSNNMFEQTIHRINGNSWRIEDGGVRFFLLEGDKKALMIDTGMNAPNARAIAESITSLPLELINTHTDLDHTSGNSAFSEIMIHSDEISNYKTTNSSQKITAVSDGEIIDLGGRRIQVISLPGHTPGSIALFDIGSRSLFSGDSIQDGHIFMFGEHRNFEDYICSLHRLFKEYNGQIDTVYPSHGSVIVPFNLIPKLEDAARKINDRLVQGSPVGIFGAKATAYSFEFASFLGEPLQ